MLSTIRGFTCIFARTLDTISDSDPVSDSDTMSDSDDDEGSRCRLLYKTTMDALCSKFESWRRSALKTLRKLLDVDTKYINFVYGNWAPNTLLATAVSEIDFEVVQILLEYGADPNVLCGRYPDQYNCIFRVSSDMRSLDIATMLINHGLDVNAKMPEGHPEDLNRYSTALHCVCMNHNFAVARMLLANGAYVNVVDSKGMTPAVCVMARNEHCSREEAAVQTIRVLMEYGADVHAIDKFGRTLVHMCAITPRGEYNMKLVRFLVVDHGVQDLLDFKGQSASDAAYEEFSFNDFQRRSSRLFGKRLQEMFEEHRHHLVSFARGNRQHGGAASRQNPGVYDWRRNAKS
jgi:ankyrin repeat protein